MISPSLLVKQEKTASKKYVAVFLPKQTSPPEDKPECWELMKCTRNYKAHKTILEVIQAINVAGQRRLFGGDAYKLRREPQECSFYKSSLMRGGLYGDVIHAI